MLFGTEKKGCFDIWLMLCAVIYFSSNDDITCQNISINVANEIDINECTLRVIYINKQIAF